MKRIAVTSPTIAEIGYDSATGILEVLFKNGRLYQYFKVSRQAYEALANATSAGQYFQTQIRGMYRYARLSDCEPRGSVGNFV